jgi:predicted house-cleaning noncanonical NTP pyrophosphatase (MazG superfamily)
MDTTNKIEEAAVDIFDRLSDEQLNVRKIALARVLDEAEHALTAAEEAGKDELAEKLRERIETLQELFDRADERTVPNDGGGEGEGSDKAETSSGESKGDKEADGDKKDGGGDGKKGKGDTDTSEGEKEKDDSSGDKKGKSGSDDDEDDWETLDVKDDDSGGKKGRDDSKTDDADEKTRYKSDVTGSGLGGDGGSDSKGMPNPFEKSFGGGGGGGGDRPTHEEIFKAAKKILSKLGGEASRGAKEGINKILSDRGYRESLERPLREAVTKVLSQMSEDEFNDELSKTMELVDQILEIDYSDDLEARVAEIKRKSMSAVDRMELEKEDAIHTKASKSALRAREVAKYEVGKKLAGMDAFKSSLYRAIRDQVIDSEEEDETWAVLNRRYEDDPNVLKKGSRMEDTYDEEGIPTINVYFDQSGSWRDSEISIGEQGVNVLKDFHNNGEIKLNRFFISAGGVFTTATAARAFPSAEGWAACLKHIRESGVKNVVILSDSDLDDYEWNNRPTGTNGKTVVPGCVWWLWKNGNVSRKALKELVGKRGNYQYSFVAH